MIDLKLSKVIKPIKEFIWTMAACNIILDEDLCSAMIVF